MFVTGNGLATAAAAAAAAAKLVCRLPVALAASMQRWNQQSVVSPTVR